MMGTFGNVGSTFVHHPSQMWAPGDFTLHITSWDAGTALTQALLAEQLRGLVQQCGVHIQWSLVPPVESQCSKEPCVYTLWAPESVGRDEPPVFRPLPRNKWSLYEPPSRLWFPASLTVCAMPELDPVVDGVHASVNALNDIGLYRSRDWRRTASAAWSPIRRGHLFLRVVHEVVTCGGKLVRASSPPVNGCTYRYEYIAYDIVMDPSDDLPSVLIDFFELHSQYLALRDLTFMLGGLDPNGSTASVIHLIECRAPYQGNTPQEPAVRVYVNDTSMLEFVLHKERIGVRDFLFLS